MSRSHDRGTKLTMLMLVGGIAAVVWVSAAIALSVSGSTEAVSGTHRADTGRVPTTEEVSELESQIAAAAQADEAEDLPSDSETSSGPIDVQSDASELQAERAAEAQPLEQELKADVSRLQDEVDAQGRELEAQASSSPGEFDPPSAEEIRQFQEQTRQ